MFFHKVSRKQLISLHMISSTIFIKVFIIIMINHLYVDILVDQFIELW